MMELGIDDDDDDDDNDENDTTTQKETNAKEKSGGEEASSSSSSSTFAAFSEGGNCSANAVYTRVQYIYRQSGASEYPLTTLAILTALFGYSPRG